MATLLRLPGLANDLWLDEVWSVTNVAGLHSWRDVFTSVRVDNNHHLNSLWLYWVGDRMSATLDRAPALLCGIGTVIVAFALGARDHLRTAVVTSALFALSFLMIYYSSEARGYAPVVFFAMAGWFSLREYAKRGTWLPLVSFWTCCGAGVLAHQTFIAFFAAGLFWCDAHVQRHTRSIRVASGRTLVAFAPPGLFFLGFYLVSIRGAAIMGGPTAGTAVVFAETLSLLGSGPSHGPGIWACALLVGGAFIASVALMARRGDDRWLLYAIGGLAMPALFAAVQQAAIYPRYFIVPGAFILLAIGDLLSRALEAGTLARSAALAGLAAMSLGTILNVAELFRLGRGRFDEAVRHMADTRAGAVTVATEAEFSMFDVRSDMLIGYFGRALHVTDHLHYVPAGSYPMSGTDWMIRESLGATPPAPTIVDANANEYVFDRAYRSMPLAGVDWLLYKRNNTPLRTAPGR